MPVRLGLPKYGGGLAEVVVNPRYATAMGLLLEGKSQVERGLMARQSGGFKSTLKRMRDWFQKNF
jgi:cell division protein FtsA